MKILIADDHELFRDSLRLVLEQLDGPPTVIDANDFDQALRAAVDHTDLDVVLMDLSMPGMDWSDAIGHLRRLLPEKVPIVVLSASDDRANVVRAVNLGAQGYIPKTSSSRVMLSALKLVLSGGVYLPAALLSNDEPEPSAAAIASVPDVLTPRQRDVLALLGQGKSNKEIARSLDLAEGTVKLHVTAILKALGVNNRTRAVVAAARLGLAIPQMADGRSK